jgi:microcystin-dependent protein
LSDQFLAEIRAFPFDFAPQGWAFCNGQLLSLSQNTALFALIGTYYGGNGASNFGLPNLQGNVPVGQGQGLGLSPYTIGDSGGAANVTLLSTEIPQHSHGLFGVASPGTTNSPAGNLPAEALGASGRGSFMIDSFAPAGTATTLSPAQIGPSGGSQPHNNMQPYLALNFCIALVGIFPPRS